MKAGYVKFMKVMKRGHWTLRMPPSSRSFLQPIYGHRGIMDYLKQMDLPLKVYTCTFIVSYRYIFAINRALYALQVLYTASLVDQD